MQEWLKTYSEIVATVPLDREVPFLYRGHADARWKLLPSLSRCDHDDADYLENNLYFEFVARAGELIPDNATSWDHVAAMQHYGLPTRLLDWTDTFAVALYFALRSGEGDATVWLLSPYAVNRAVFGRPELLSPFELPSSFYDYFVTHSAQFPGAAAAILPPRQNPRIHRQGGAFTVHADLDTPLDELFPEALTAIRIPAGTRAGARQFLKLAGISEFRLFPELEGLSRELLTRYLPGAHER